MFRKAAPSKGIMSLLTSAHMKSEVKTKFPGGDGRNAFSLWASQDNRSKVRATCVGAVFFGASLCRQPSPRIHSTVRFGERSQAHMGDSGLCLLCSFSRSFFSLLLHFIARSKVIGELSGQGTSQLRGLSRTVHPRRTFGSLPASRIRCRSPARFQPGGVPHCASRTWLSRWVGLRYREIVWRRTPAGFARAPAGCAGSCAGC